MSDIGEMYRQMKQERQRDGERRRAQAAIEYVTAARLAGERGGLKLTQHSDTHYTLVRPLPHHWRIELYPGNQRIYRSLGGAPFLKMPQWREWTLRDAVEAALAAIGVAAKESEP